MGRSPFWLHIFSPRIAPNSRWHGFRSLRSYRSQLRSGMPGVKPYDEMHAEDGGVREHYRTFASWLAKTPKDRVAQKRTEADSLFHRVGITFAVYGEEAGTERLIPFDIVPRVVPAAEWELLAAGLRQRVRALNAF